MAARKLGDAPRTRVRAFTLIDVYVSWRNKDEVRIGQKLRDTTFTAVEGMDSHNRDAGVAKYASLILFLIHHLEAESSVKYRKAWALISNSLGVGWSIQEGNRYGQELVLLKTWGLHPLGCRGCPPQASFNNFNCTREVSPDILCWIHEHKRQSSGLSEGTTSSSSITKTRTRDGKHFGGKDQCNIVAPVQLYRLFRRPAKLFSGRVELHGKCTGRCSSNRSTVDMLVYLYCHL